MFMSKNRINVAPCIWQWVLTNVALTEKNRAEIETWASQDKLPTFSQLEKLSRKIHVPFGYFILNTPPEEELELLKFRTIGSLESQPPSRDLIDTAKQMENVQDWMREYLVLNGFGRNDFVGSVKKTGTPLAVASKIRSVLNITENWYEQVSDSDKSFKFLRERISKTDVVVMMSGIVANNTFRPLNIKEFRAFTLIDDFAPLIFINSTDSTEGKIFSLLHEFIHVGIASNSMFNVEPSNFMTGSPVETFCNRITAEILVPIAAFTKKWDSSADEVADKINQLSRYFKCSRFVIARRALDSHFINHEEYALVTTQVKLRTSKKKGSGGNFYLTQASRIDRRFLLALDSSVKEGKTLYTEAFRLTNTSNSSFKNLIRTTQGVQV
jgi:Zn-dependent peptidase ImmA (M78 family)